MPLPREPAVQVEAEVFNIVSLGELHVVEMDRRAGSTSQGDICDMGRLSGVGFQSPSLKPGLDGAKVDGVHVLSEGERECLEIWRVTRSSPQS
jgi:hypothetical protein